MTLDPTIKHILMPALAGAAGTGALSAYLTHHNEDPNEPQDQRRKRLIRNALIGSAAGGLAGGALPAGLKMISQPFSDSKGGVGSRLLDAGVGAAGSHALPLAAGAAGGVAISKSLKANRQNAGKDLLGYLNSDKGGNPDMTDQDLRMTLGTPEGRMNILHKVEGRFRGPEGIPNEGRHAIFKSRELMQEAGHKAPGLGELQELFKQSPVMGDYKNYLAEQGGLAHPLNWGAAEIMGKGPNLKRFKIMKWLASQAKVNPEGPAGSQLAELYGNMVRPGAKNFMGGRMGILGKLGLMGAGVGGAEYLQQKLMNQ